MESATPFELVSLLEEIVELSSENDYERLRSILRGDDLLELEWDDVTTQVLSAPIDRAIGNRSFEAVCVLLEFLYCEYTNYMDLVSEFQLDVTAQAIVRKIRGFLLEELRLLDSDLGPNESWPFFAGGLRRELFEFVLFNSLLYYDQFPDLFCILTKRLSHRRVQENVRVGTDSVCVLHLTMYPRFYNLSAIETVLSNDGFNPNHDCTVFGDSFDPLFAFLRHRSVAGQNPVFPRSLISLFLNYGYHVNRPSFRGRLLDLYLLPGPAVYSQVVENRDQFFETVKMVLFAGARLDTIYFTRLFEISLTRLKENAYFKVLPFLLCQMSFNVSEQFLNSIFVSRRDCLSEDERRFLSAVYAVLLLTMPLRPDWNCYLKGAFSIHVPVNNFTLQNLCRLKIRKELFKNHCCTALSLTVLQLRTNLTKFCLRYLLFYDVPDIYRLFSCHDFLL